MEGSAVRETTSERYAAVFMMCPYLIQAGFEAVLMATRECHEVTFESFKRRSKVHAGYSTRPLGDVYVV